jgi:sensor histidine kinase YesM
LRHANSFEYVIETEPDIDLSVPVPKMIIQIHAENSVKHGLAPRKEGGKLVIEVKSIVSGILILVTDNGIGREKAKQSETVSSGMGLSLMEEFYALYNKLYNQKISSYISDLKNEKEAVAGTSVQINIDLSYE